jgi:hypothetical protein
VHNVDLNFCNCDSKIERRQQLMRVCWWPATVRDPKTCATFAVVRLFQFLNCLGKVSTHDFLHSLELLSNNDGLNPVAVRTLISHLPEFTDHSLCRITNEPFSILCGNTG